VYIFGIPVIAAEIMISNCVYNSSLANSDNSYLRYKHRNLVANNAIYKQRHVLSQVVTIDKEIGALNLMAILCKNQQIWIQPTTEMASRATRRLLWAPKALKHIQLVHQVKVGARHHILEVIHQARAEMGDQNELINEELFSKNVLPDFHTCITFHEIPTVTDVQFWRLIITMLQFSSIQSVDAHCMKKELKLWLEGRCTV
jgi:hypothetical protein